VVVADDGPKAVGTVAGTADDHGPGLSAGREDDSADASDYAAGFLGSPWFTGVGAVCDTVTRLAGVDGAAVAVFAPSDSRELVYATDAVAQQVDDLQFTLGEGPCLDAYRSASPQLCPRLDAGIPMNRWPAFCIDAGDVGVQAVFAFPVLGTEHAIGVLELYRRSTGELDPRQYQSATVCAEAVGQTLMSSWDIRLAMEIDAAAAMDAASAAAAPNPGGTFSRAGVYIAAGMVAVQLGVSADDGLDRLRAYTYANGLSINAVAADIVARRLSLRGMRDEPGQQP
jgi:GAF domain